MSSIFDGEELPFCPQAAKRFGLNEAIIIQQIYGNSTDSSKLLLCNGHTWFACSFSDWAKLLCFIPEPTIKKNILGLEKLGVVISCEPYKREGDRTKAYRINVDLYKKMMEGK